MKQICFVIKMSGKISRMKYGGTTIFSGSWPPKRKNENQFLCTEISVVALPLHWKDDRPHKKTFNQHFKANF